MPRRSRLVVQHLEDLSWRILDDYREAVGEMIGDKSGVYALYKGRRLYYIGLARNLMGRLKDHFRDRHRGSWDRFSVYLTARDDHMKEIEGLLIRIVDPKGNRAGGRLTGSKDLQSTLSRAMRERDHNKRKLLLKGDQVRPGPKLKKGRKKVRKLLVDRSTPLKGWNRNWEYRATLRRDGTVRYNGEVFSSPSGAAKAALGKAVSGRSFWHYRDHSGRWVKLSALSK